MVRVSDIKINGGSNNLDPRQVIAAYNHMNTLQDVWMYCNRAVATQLDIQQNEKANVEHSPTHPWGFPVRYFMGVPVALNDAISNAETATAA